MAMKARETILAAKGNAAPSTSDRAGERPKRPEPRRVLKLTPLAGGVAGAGQGTGVAAPVRVAHDARGNEARDVKKFTLRLDKDRHRRLHLAMEIERASGQTLLIRLLDLYLKQRLGPGRVV